MGNAETKDEAAGRKNRDQTAVSNDGNAGGCFYHDLGTGIFVISVVKEENGMWNKIKQFMKDEQGITSVEIILILVVLIALVLIFKEQMTKIVNDIFKTITSQSGKVLK